MSGLLGWGCFNRSKRTTRCGLDPLVHSVNVGGELVSAEEAAVVARKLAVWYGARNLLGILAMRIR